MLATRGARAALRSRSARARASSPARCSVSARRRAEAPCSGSIDLGGPLEGRAPPRLVAEEPAHARGVQPQRGAQGEAGRGLVGHGPRLVEAPGLGQGVDEGRPHVPAVGALVARGAQRLEHTVLAEEVGRLAAPDRQGQPRRRLAQRLAARPGQRVAAGGRVLVAGQEAGDGVGQVDVALQRGAQPGGRVARAAGLAGDLAAGAPGGGVTRVELAGQRRVLEGLVEAPLLAAQERRLALRPGVAGLAGQEVHERGLGAQRVDAAQPLQPGVLQPDVVREARRRRAQVLAGRGRPLELGQVLRDALVGARVERVGLGHLAPQREGRLQVAPARGHGGRRAAPVGEAHARAGGLQQGLGAGLVAAARGHVGRVQGQVPVVGPAGQGRLQGGRGLVGGAQLLERPGPGPGYQVGPARRPPPARGPSSPQVLVAAGVSDHEAASRGRR